MSFNRHPILDPYIWHNRLLLIFMPDEAHEAYQVQVKELKGKEKSMAERDILVFSIFNEQVKLPDGQVLSAEEARSLRESFIIPAKESVVLLIGKDGTEKLRSRDLITARRLFLTIDAMPMRNQEIASKQRQS